jgi:hypothetical protein
MVAAADSRVTGPRPQVFPLRSFASQAKTAWRAPAAQAGAAARSPAGASDHVLPRAAHLTIGPAGDSFEREADAAAAQVLRMPATGMPDAPTQAGAPPPLQAKSDGAHSAAPAPPIVHDTLNSQGRPLDAETRSFFEPRFQRDFGGVRLHTGAQAAQASRAIGARAFTAGQNIAFGAGQYAPGTQLGRSLIAHELAHTVQQGHAAAWSVQRAPDEKAAPSFDYLRIVAQHGAIDVGVAIGSGSFADGAHGEYKASIDVLAGHKFNKVADKPLLKYSKDKELAVPGAKSKAPVKFKMNVELMNEFTKKPKDTYANFLATKDIAIYSGHARMGTGPDFDGGDDDTVHDQNFIIGVNSSLHDGKHAGIKEGHSPEKNKSLKGKTNDLEEMSKAGKFDDKAYRIWMFNACTSKEYLDEIRGGLVTNKPGKAGKAGKAKTNSELRFFGTKHSIYSAADNLLASVVELRTADETIKTMDETERQNVIEHNKNPRNEKTKLYDSYYFTK